MTPYAEQLDGAQRAVLLAARAHRTPDELDELSCLVAHHGAAQIRRSAVQNKCEALVGHSLDCALPGSVPDDWIAAVHENRLRVESLARTLSQVLAAFRQHAIPAAVIEGANSAFSARLPLAAYGAGDFDVLVSTQRWSDARATLAGLGFRPANRRDRQTVRIEFRRDSPHGKQWIEVGCQPFDRKWVPLIYTDRSATWLARRITVEHEIAGKVPVLCASDAMTVAAYHASLHSYVRSPALRLQVDIDRAARHPGLDWDAFVAEVRVMGATTRAYVSLRIANALLATPVPKDVLDALDPGERRWNALARLLGDEGVMDVGDRKLVGWKALRLDQLLHEGGTSDWLRNLALPPTPWMRDHFGSGPVWRMHARRYIQAGTRWRRDVG